MKMESTTTRKTICFMYFVKNYKMANTNIDKYIDWLKKGSEVQYNWIIHIIQNCDSHNVEILEKWWEIAEEVELLELLETK